MIAVFITANWNWTVKLVSWAATLWRTRLRRAVFSKSWRKWKAKLSITISRTCEHKFNRWITWNSLEQLFGWFLWNFQNSKYLSYLFLFLSELERDEDHERFFSISWKEFSLNLEILRCLIAIHLMLLEFLSLTWSWVFKNSFRIMTQESSSVISLHRNTKMLSIIDLKVHISFGKPITLLQCLIQASLMSKNRKRGKIVIKF